jgi:recombination protein RecA
LNKKLEETLKNLNKKYGEGTVRHLGEQNVTPIKRISTGILSLDYILGGGYPVGRIIEIFGKEASGKTAIATYGLIEIQKAGYEIGIVDLEQTFNPIYAKNNGLDIGNLIFSQPETGEQAMDIVEALALSGVKGILYDSVASTMSKFEGEKDMGDPTIGMQARLMSQCLRRINPTINKNDCILFFVNQLREKIGTYSANPETTPGGRALKFYATIRMNVRPVAFIGPNGQEIKTKEEAVGHKIKVRVEKNKTFIPYKTCEFDFYYGVGVDQISDIINTAVACGLISRAGSWFSYIDIEGTELRVQGLQKMKETVQEKQLIKEIKERVLEIVTNNNCTDNRGTGEDIKKTKS